MKFDLQTSMHYHVKSTTQQYYPSDTKEAQEASGNIAWDDARDGQHPSIQTHVEISRHFSTP